MSHSPFSPRPARSCVQRAAAAALLAAVLPGLACRQNPATARARYLERGNKSAAAGQFREASINYRKAIQADPNFGEAYYRLGLAEQAQGHIKDSYYAYSRVAQLQPDHVDARIKLAELLMSSYVRDSTRSEAVRAQIEKVLTEALSKKPDSVDGLRLRGELEMAAGNIPAAIEFLRKAQGIEPSNMAVILGLTQALFRNKQEAEAETLAKNYLGKHGGGAAPIYNLLYAYYTRTSRTAGQAEEIRKLQVTNNPDSPESLLQLADHYRSVSKKAEMDAVLRQYASRFASTPKARLKSGDFYAAAGQWEEALREYERGAAAEAGERGIYDKRAAQAMLSQGKRAEGMKRLDDLLARDPNDVEARGIRAVLLAEQSLGAELDRAIAEFRLVVEKEPDNALLRFQYGRACLRRGRLEEARAAFQKAAQQRERYLPPRLGLAQVALAMKQYRVALRHLDEVLAYDPGNPAVRILRAAASTGLGNFGEARGDLLRLLRETPGSVDVQLQLGLVAIGEKKYAEAVEIFRKLHQPGRTDLRPLEGLIEAYVGQQQSDTAIALLKGELEKTPNSGPLRWALASTALHAGDLDLAAEQYGVLLARNDRAADLHTRVADVYARKRDIESAIRHLERARALDPDDPSPLPLLGQLLAERGKMEEALGVYRRLLQLRPDDPFAMNNVAYLLVEMNRDLDEALKLAKVALQRVPQHPNISDTIGLIYLRRNMLDSALYIFNNLIGQQASNPAFRYHFALVLVSKGDRARARAELQAALAQNPSPGLEEKIRALMNSLPA